MTAKLQSIIAWRSNENNAAKSRCRSIPAKAVLLTSMNAGFVETIRLQVQGMQIGNSWTNCLDAVYVVLCLDKPSVQLCKEIGVLHCVKLPFAMVLPFSDYAEDAYHYITWLKHSFMYVALKTMDQAILVDSDIVVFKNPFDQVPYGRDEKGVDFPFEYDIMYQRELGRGRGCNGTINTGVYYLRNTSATHRFFACMFTSKQKLVEEGTFEDLEQGYAQTCKNAAEMSSCVFNANKFISRAHGHNNRDGNRPIGEVFTYHAAGGTRGYSHKLVRMRNFIKDFKQNPKKKIQNF